MPWVPELFSAPTLTRLLEARRRDSFETVPFYDGLLAGELAPLVKSFAGEPELHHPVRGRIRGNQRALAAGDVDAILAAFAPDGYAREPAGGEYVHRGSDGLRAFYEQLFSNAGGIPLEHCGLVENGRACALEYNVVRWGKTELPPQAGVAVYVRGEGGKLAAARIYDDADPPLGVAEQAPTT